MERQLLAKWTWYAEVLCLVLTCVYCMIAFLDIGAGRARLTSASWFSEGFCIWRSSPAVSSHTLCFFTDLVVGGAMAARNWQLYQKHDEKVLLIGFFLSLFNVMHGMGHLGISLFSEGVEEVINSGFSSPLMFARNYVVVFSFLAIAPYLGHCFGVSPVPCLLIHAASTAAFMFVPGQFAFGAIQLVLNVWFCLPRILWIGYDTADDVSKRVDDGWAAGSIGIAAIMPVVFAEMLGCDAFYQAILGHYLYDCSTLILSAAFCASVWRQCGKSKQS